MRTQQRMFLLMDLVLRLLLLCQTLSSLSLVHSWIPPVAMPTTRSSSSIQGSSFMAATPVPTEAVSQSSTIAAGAVVGDDNEDAVAKSPQNDPQQDELFEDFVDFLLSSQSDIIERLEDLEKRHGSKVKFTKDTWGMFDKEEEEGTASSSKPTKPVGGITRVLQGGSVIEKGACSFTLIGTGVLSRERAATIRGRQKAGEEGTAMIQEGDEYAAAALSMVLHSRSPHVPTFRSDVRVFLVKPKQKPQQRGEDGPAASVPPTMAWFGGGADLTPYYLNHHDITQFHLDYYALCDNHWGGSEESEFSYRSMKKACDEYFYLPARQEHRGTGGIFFDDMEMTVNSLAFVKGVCDTWMPSWIPIAEKRQSMQTTDQQRHWQWLRRGRYLEFNLLYDRGVRFGLASVNPRVEGVMVSAPPRIAFDYNHPIVPGSPEAQLMEVLKKPKEWV